MRLVQLTAPGRLELSLDVLARFWSKVEQHGPIIYEELGPCWTWTGATTRGYGQLWVNGKFEYAHRLSYGIHVRILEPSEKALHKCDNPGCPNPDHLKPGSQKDNATDRDSRKRRTPPVGSKHGCSKLVEDEVSTIKLRRAAGEALRVIGDDYGVSESTIHLICAGKTWRHAS